MLLVYATEKQSPISAAQTPQTDKPNSFSLPRYNISSFYTQNVKALAIWFVSDLVGKPQYRFPRNGPYITSTCFLLMSQYHKTFFLISS